MNGPEHIPDIDEISESQLKRSLVELADINDFDYEHVRVCVECGAVTLAISQDGYDGDQLFCTCQEPPEELESIDDLKGDYELEKALNEKASKEPPHARGRE